MTTRIYVVMNKADDSRRLVEAATAEQAIRHCVNNVYEAKIAGTKEIAGMMREGLQVEVAEPKRRGGKVMNADGSEKEEVTDNE